MEKIQNVRSTNFFYDENGRLIKESVHNKVYKKISYEKYHEYDDTGKLIHKYRSDNRYDISCVYDENGNHTSDIIIKNNEKYITNYVYDDHNRLIREYDVFPENSDIKEFLIDNSYEYDHNNNLTCIINNTTGHKYYRTNEYDDNNRLLRWTTPKTICDFEYDINGNLIKETLTLCESNRHVIHYINTYTYDENNKCILETKVFY